jgi:hypothetical protein
MKQLIHFILFLFTTQKTVLSNLFGASLQGQTLTLHYNSERFVIYTTHETGIVVFYGAAQSPLEFARICSEYREEGEGSVLSYTTEISMDTAAEYIKETWRKRQLPPRIEPPFMFLLMAIGGIGLVEMIGSFILYAWRYML